MARKILEIKINEDTPQAELELCAIAAERTSDINIQRKAAEARAELTRRERQFQIEMLNAQSKERVKAQKFQAAQSKREEEAVADSKDIDPRNVMVVHGRDEDLRTSMFDFLRSLQLSPIEWEHAVKATGSASPHTLDIVIKAFEIAKAVVVLMTGDDLAKLHPELLSTNDPDYESELTPQPRANVLFEAGMALALHRDRTVPVTIGKVRPFSNIAGINLVRLDNTAEKRNALASRLEGAGCSVNKIGSDWLTAGNFEVSRAAPVSPQEDEDQERAHDFSKEEVSILKALFDNREITEDEIAIDTGFKDSMVRFWIGELEEKGVIYQVEAGVSPGDDSYAIRAGQVDMLRRIGVM